MSDAPTTLDAPVTNRSEWFWLRVAVSTFSGLLTVALCVLWVRSYWYWDSVGYRILPNRTLVGHSALGVTWIYTVPINPGESYDGGMQSDAWGDGVDVSALEFTNGGFHVSLDELESSRSFPYWFLVAVFGATSAASLFLRRFCLRTMLIATTLVAVVLGLVVWAVR